MRVEIVGKGGISALVVCDSRHPHSHGRRLTTLQLRYPRFIHSEFMTHRVFSRNASSSRAIPVAKMIEQVRNDAAMPIHWGKNMPGMQANEELDLEHKSEVKGEWNMAAQNAADSAEFMMKEGAHKQIVNRILEPFQFISVIVTATEWENFFELRDHPDAQPEIQELARVMKAAIQASKPDELGFGDWHLPYVTKEEKAKFSIADCRRMSAARCARVSYLTHDGQTPSPEKDFDLFDKLVGSVPLHASPIEHQATADQCSLGMWHNQESWGNFRHWIQFRKLWENHVTEETHPNEF